MSGIEYIAVDDPGHNYKSANMSPDGKLKEYAFTQALVDMKEKIYERIPQIKQVKTKELMTWPTSLEGRVKVANNNKAKLFQSDHSNAFGTYGEWTSPRGFGIYIHTDATKESIRLAEIGRKWAREILLPFGLPDRGIRKRNFYVVNPKYINCPSALWEWAFHSNKEDVKLLLSDDFRKACAEVSVRTACEFLGVKYVEGDTIMAAKQHIVVSGETMYRISRNYKIALNELIKMNPHIEEPTLIHPGDIVFLEEPNQFEVKHATLNRELVLCKKSEGEIEQLKAALIEAQKEINARVADNTKMLNDIRIAQSAFFKYV